MLYAVFYAIQAAVAVALPIVFLAKYSKKYQSEKSSKGNGVAVFFIFGAAANSVLSLYITGMFKPSSPFVQNLWLSALVSAVINTVCVVLGKFIWFKFVMKEANSKHDAVMFGGGYATWFMVMSYAVSAIVSVVFALLNVFAKDTQISEILRDTYEIYASSSYYQIFLVTIQCVLLGACELFTSITLFGATKKQTSPLFFVAGTVLSFGIYFVPYIPLSLEINLIILAVITLLTSYTAYITYKKAVH